jgi:hypothetical protein
MSPALGRRLVSDQKTSLRDRGIVELVTQQSRWLIDLARRRFQRLPRGHSTERAVEFGAWRDFESFRVHAEDVVVVTPLGQPPIRVHLTPRAAGRTADGSGTGIASS